MAVTHSYNILSLKQRGDGSGIVCCVSYRIVSTESSTGTSVTVATDCMLGDPAPGEQIPYESLDSATVVGWLQTNAMPPSLLFEQQNSGRIASIDSPLTVEPLPWLD